MPGVVALVAVAVAFGVELSGLHKSTHVFVVYIQRYIHTHTHPTTVYYDEVDNNMSERQRANNKCEYK